jgi:hypothetical protein
VAASCPRKTAGAHGPGLFEQAAKGWHLPNKETALGVIQRVQAEGRISIDIGCMQINLRFHGTHSAAYRKRSIRRATSLMPPHSYEA